MIVVLVLVLVLVLAGGGYVTSTTKDHTCVNN